MSIGKLDGGTTESHGETGRQRLHLQHRSGKTHNGKRVGAHGIPHQLINGGQFGFLKGIAGNRQECSQDTHSQDTSVQYSLITARTAHSMRLASLKFKTIRYLQASLCPNISLVIHHAPSFMNTSSFDSTEQQTNHMPQHGLRRHRMYMHPPTCPCHSVTCSPDVLRQRLVDRRPCGSKSRSIVQNATPDHFTGLSISIKCLLVVDEVCS